LIIAALRYANLMVNPENRIFSVIIYIMRQFYIVITFIPIEAEPVKLAGYPQ
jgi:hypothetical protein